MKHLLIAASLSGALLADAIILEEYTIENEAEGYKSTDVKILCMNGYEWVHSRIYSMIAMNQVFVENNNNRSTPKKMQHGF